MWRKIKSIFDLRYISWTTQKKPHHFDKLTQERYDSLSAVFVRGWQIDFITKYNQPSRQLYRWQNNTIGSSAILAIVIKSFHKQFWSRRRRKVNVNDIHILKNKNDQKIVSQVLQKTELILKLTWRDRNADKSVIVFPDPGGPHKTSGLCSESHVFSNISCLTVSTVGITKSAAATRWVSTSITGTLDVQGTQSPEIDAS